MRSWPSTWAPKPNLSSKSIRDFDECQWRYWLAHGPKEETPDWAPVERRLMPWAAYVGQVVDDVLKEAVLGYRASGEWPGNLQERGREILRIYWRESKEYRRLIEARKLPAFGGRSPVDRFYYGDDIPKETRQLVRARVEQCLKAFATCGIRDFLSHYPRESLMLTRPVEEEPIPWFRVGEAPVYASYDLVVRTDEAIVIVDWKTGKRNSWSESRITEQLHLYAQFAMTTWGATPESISLIPVWLGEGADWSPIAVEPERLNALSTALQQRFELLVKKWRDCNRDPGAVEAVFPMTERMKTCRDCTFRSCLGYARSQAVSVSEPADATEACDEG